MNKNKGKKEMVCANCGAPYDKTLNQCPYCGAENKSVTDREFNSLISNKKKEIKEEKNKSSKFVAAFKNKTVIIITCIGVLILALFLFIILSNTGSDSYTIETDYLEELENARLAGDYGLIEEILNDNQLRGGRYKGYENLEDVYYYYKQFEEGLDENDPAGLKTILMSANHCIITADDILAGDSKYGTEEDIAAIREEVYASLTELGMTKEDIASFSQDWLSDFDTDASERLDALIQTLECKENINEL